MAIFLAYCTRGIIFEQALGKLHYPETSLEIEPLQIIFTLLFSIDCYKQLISKRASSGLSLHICINRIYLNNCHIVFSTK